MYDVYSEFDIKKHMKYFVNYLEVVIHPDGSIHYAVPSHKIYLEMYCADKLGMTYTEFQAVCPPERYSDYLCWLTEQSNCVSVWSYGYGYHKMTLNQKIAVTQLIQLGLLKQNRLRL